MPEIAFHHAEVVVPTADGDLRVLHPIDLRLGESTIALIGANGSGKSTLARLINGLQLASSGQVLVDGIDVARESRRIRAKVAFSFSDPGASLVMPTAAEDVALSLRRTHRNKAARRQASLEVLARYGLAELADRSVHTLSGGERQLLALAGCLAVNPEILVADEPTTLLDLVNSRRIANLLLSLPQQVVIATHDLDLAARCQRALLIDDGAVVADGDPATVIADYVSRVEQGS